MVELIPIILTYIAMAIYLIVLFILTIVIRRTRGKFKTVLILWFIIVIFSLVRRTLNLLNLSDILNNEIWDDLFAIINASLLLLSMYILFREIRRMTDVEMGRREEHTPKSRPKYFEENENRPELQRQERIEERPIQRPLQSQPQRETRRLRVINGYVDFTKDRQQ